MNATETKRSVVITGATGGLGSAVVKVFHAGGFAVHAVCRSEDDHRRLAATAGVTPHIVADLTDESAVARLYESVGELWASVHLAGGFAAAAIEATKLDDARRMFEINALTSLACCREAVKAMRKTGGGGRIVNVAARPAVSPVGGMIAYSMSKAAVANLTQSLAAEVLADRILVNAVIPSMMDTPANRAALPEADHSKWPKVEEVAQTIAYLASPANALTHGALVPVYGQS